MIADDHSMVRLGLRTLINSETDMAVASEAATASEVRNYFNEQEADLILLDLRMPGVHGVSLLRWLRQEHPSVKILIYSAYFTEEDIYQAIRHGARGYLIKTATGEEIVTTIRAIHEGERRIAPVISGGLAERMRRAELTKRETAVLKLMANGSSNGDISRELSISESAVKHHVSSLQQKLGVANRIQAINVARERGIFEYL
jgi:two-component system NarL family response regulator